nr:DNA polymerase V subunit UmuC [Candidatus Pantoea persica]
MTTLEKMAPAVEMYSIDEAFLDLSGVSFCQPLEMFGQQVQARVLRETHLQVGVGIASTKTLAKLANYAAKKYRGTQGVVDLSCVERQRKLMALVPVEEVWGVGGRLSKKLRQMGIENALQLAESS